MSHMDLLQNRKVIIQGITGRQGTVHARQMLEYGTQIVGGVTPGKGGSVVDGIPVYNTVSKAMDRTGATGSVVFVPSTHAKGAIVEGIEAGLETMVVITEKIPIHDTMNVLALARKNDMTLLGPNCPGLCLVGESKVGVMPNQIFREGGISVISRSGTLTYEVVRALSDSGLGQDVVIGLGGDRLLGLSIKDAMEMVLERSPKAIVLIGEIGGQMEEEATELIEKIAPLKVYGYIAGISAPKAIRMGHAGAIINGGRGGAREKIIALEGAGAIMVNSIDRLVQALKNGV